MSCLSASFQFNLSLFVRRLSLHYLGYVPVTAPAYFTVWNVRVSEKFFAYVAIAVVSFGPISIPLHQIWHKSVAYKRHGPNNKSWDPFYTPATPSTLLLCSLLFTTHGTRRCLPGAVRWWLSCIGQFFHLSSALGCRVNDYSR